jgi:hypothetical protein
LATLLALIEAGRKAQVIRKLPKEEQLSRLKRSLEHAREEAIARGIALEDDTADPMDARGVVYFVNH